MALISSRVDLTAEEETRLVEQADLSELSGFIVDFEVVYFDSWADLEILVFLDEQLAGVAHNFDDITTVIDRYQEERVDD